MVNVYDSLELGESSNVIAEVKYNNNLDSYPHAGRHLGLTMLSDGQYVLIHGSDYEGEKDYAEIITPEYALQCILKSGNDFLFESFPELSELRKKLIQER